MDIQLRFGMHRDVELIHDAAHTIDGLVIPAHILAYQTPSTSAFVTSLPGKDYVIDPMTFIFQNPRNHHLSDSNPSQLRPSVGNLCDEYHASLAASVKAHKDLAPNNFPDLAEFCQNVATFQLDAVRNGSEESAARKYLDRYELTRPTQPLCLLAPYFRFGEARDEWYTLSLRCATLSAELDTDIPVAPVICCPAGTLQSGESRIVEDYGGFKYVYIWVDDYKETRATVDEIRAVKRFVRSLVASGVERVAALYGGYLQVMSAHDGLRSVSHGVLYTEDKSYRLSPGSGGPPERYYIPRFHQFRSLSQTDLILHQHPQLMCSCEVCVEVLEGNPDNIIRYFDEPELLRRHFLTVRRSEADQIEGQEPADVAAALRQTYAAYHDSVSQLPNPDAIVSNSSMSGLEYLRVWAEALEHEA